MEGDCQICTTWKDKEYALLKQYIILMGRSLCCNSLHMMIIWAYTQPPAVFHATPELHAVCMIKGGFGMCF